MHSPYLTMEEDENGYWITVAGLIVVELVQMKSKHYLIIYIIIVHLSQIYPIWFNIKTPCFTEYSQDIFILKTCYSQVLELSIHGICAADSI